MSVHLCYFETRDSECETIPDEDYNSLCGQKKKVNSCHIGLSNYPKLSEGPNINLSQKKLEEKKRLNYVKIGKFIMIVFLKMNALLPTD